MLLCAGIHFHLSTSLIIPFHLPPPKNLPHLFNQARQIPPPNPLLFSDCFPPREGGEGGRTRPDVTERVESNLSLRGACVLFLLNGIHLSELPSSVASLDAFNHKWAEVLHVNINEAVNKKNIRSRARFYYMATFPLQQVVADLILKTFMRSQPGLTSLRLYFVH